MEYSWGYAAARTPFPTVYQHRPPPPSPSSSGPPAEQQLQLRQTEEESQHRRQQQQPQERQEGRKDTRKIRKEKGKDKEKEKEPTRSEPLSRSLSLSLSLSQPQVEQQAPPQARPIDPHFYPPFLRASRPTRSNSISGATPSRRRPRILGHSRTSSSSSRSRSSNETALQHYYLDAGTSPPTAPPPALPAGGAGAAFDTESPTASAGTSLDSTATQNNQAKQPQPQLQQRLKHMPASVKYYQTKQLPATPVDAHDTTTTTTAAAGVASSSARYAIDERGKDESLNLTTTRSNTNTVQRTKSGSSSEPSSARTPSSATTPKVPWYKDISLPVTGSESSPLTTGLGLGYLRPAHHPSALTLEDIQQQLQEYNAAQAAMPSDTVPSSGKNPPAAGVSTPFAIPSSSAAAGNNRAESISSTSGATSLSGRTMFSTDPPPGAEAAAMQLRPFVVRNGRSYVSDPTLHYPLPVDLAELHRQSLRTLLLFQLFGGPICSPVYANKPPTRVLEVGCGSAFWSMMCHRYWLQYGHTNISFTGIDIAPIAPGASGHGTTSTRTASTTTDGSGNGIGSSNRASASSTSTSGLDGRPDRDMKWRFVQHDMRRLPWPFAEGEFDLVMVKDMSLATPLAMQQTLMDEYVRLLRPGGVLEIWESDYTLRMLRPHVPHKGQSTTPAGPTSQQQQQQQQDDEDDSTTSDSDSEEDEHERAANIGAYLMTAHTPLSAPLNNFLVEYNGWVARALESRSLSAVPCTLIGSLLLQEVETLTGIGSRRLAVPLSEVRWEREGVGGVVTKDGKSYIETKGRRGGNVGKRGEGAGGKSLGAGQAAVRRTALLTVVMQIQSLEAVLREVSGKSQDEWDGWCGKMMNDLVKENGTSWGECLEIGAWWARKKA